ncbi:Z1 domain-containing protein [Mesorhizobium sp. B292B1B]|uniref:Z1 domain-containing protein n=1 Tax=unclassified Mesorhizobium TaxID=325217 RepID=UPI0015E338F0|nr:MULTISPECIES: Z1 domain-containing protein [unclassified Mesorhizobium]MCA0015564.1 Z1 domain-containing protein [Mesorhizobium sp. B294B1A1]MCA0041370.1 Z1 domain-containing protein [Mesorhizobium sp. B292B1B]
MARQLSPTALEVLHADARYIVEKALPTSGGKIDAAAWPEDGLRTGMVIGSVQSGKTASMLAVASLALDQGVDIVVLLAGTRVGLWLQTYERMLSQLDGSNRDTAYARANVRLVLPQPEDVLSSDRMGPTSYLKASKATLAVRQGIPMIIVVPKLDEHLLHLSRMLRSVLSGPVLASRDRATTMLVLDDEADDASVLDSATSEKVTPRFIAALWSGDHHRSASRDTKLRATYIAYTATPQANYLQESHNPLAPREFSAALRVAGHEGELMPRSLTYCEPSGIRGYYCGGDIYYDATSFLSGPLTVSWPYPELQPGETEAELADRREMLRWEAMSAALRSYMVGAAARLLIEGGRFSDVAGRAFPSKDALNAAMPRAHTMMFHPSVRKDAHFAAAEDIARWSRALPGHEREVELPEAEDGEPSVALDPPGLAIRLQAEEEAWRACYLSFENSRLALSSFPRAAYPRLDASRWNEVYDLLLTEIFPNVSLRVLNSDPSADDRPRFDAVEDTDGWHAPVDLLTIFVAGNILSRGLTVEGLATSLFLRSSAEPAADTQMQMQRWFGYRGAHLPFCRVFLLEDQLALFRQYNVRDKALKSLVLRRMALPKDETAAGTLILEGLEFVATSKIETRKIPLSPGPSPQIRLIERANPNFASHNTNLLTSALKRGNWDEIDPSRNVGRIRSEPLGLLELADLLDQLRYTRHDPSLGDELSRRWTSIQHSLGLTDALFRPPGLDPKPYAVRPQSCPYAIAAYLRLWHALATGHHAPGFHATDKADLPWSQLDGRVVPQFYLAVRSGEKQSTDPNLRTLGVGAMIRGIGSLDRLNTLWGSRGYDSSGYYGDQFIDYHYHGRKPVPRLQSGDAWRPRGHPGLALFHVIRDDQGGPDVVTLGLGLPHGGPDHIAALRR